jgi:hypothetical protein
MKSLKQALTIKLFFLFAFAVPLSAQEGFSKQAFYDAMRSDNLQQVEAQLKAAEAASAADKNAIIGTLTMKKAGLIRGAGKKLNTFKAGHEKLEASIKADQDNPEYRFMRLMIQEHAPGILGYKDEIQKDSDYIRKSFKTLSGTVQKAIMNYAKEKSKVLSEKDFN